MGRLALLGAVALVAAACGTGGTDAGDTGAAAETSFGETAREAGDRVSARPALEVLSTSPLRIAGTGFRPNELVRLTVEADGRTFALSRRADRLGRFWARLPGTACTATVDAVGVRGSRTSASFAHVTCPPTS